MLKSADERAAERREREAFAATPVGGATAAMKAGQLFYEVQLQVGAHVGSAVFSGIQGQHTTSSSAATLGEIEKLGWHLEHAGYYFRC